MVQAGEVEMLQVLQSVQAVQHSLVAIRQRSV